jgi:O-acetyl-ADP-ribose deacetylase (regulator of RNase III)
MVNAANTSLEGGGGVDGAIHRAGGSSILEECRSIGGCPTGESVVTTAGELPCEKVIHTVGPVYKDGKSGEKDLLTQCHLSSLSLAEEHQLRHVAFSAISTGVYGYPKEEASLIAMEAVKAFLDKVGDATRLRRITFVLFSKEDYETYQNSLFRVFPEG